MVIILQQTLEEDGHRFVSTVVEGEETPFTSGYSMNSQQSISERSAVYKQRIDQLFGRPSRLSPFLPNGDSGSGNEVCIVNGKSAHPRPTDHREGRGPFAMLPHPHSDNDDGDDDEDSYSRITDRGSASSVITDSLNHRAIKSSWDVNGNVSSVRISCDVDVETATPPPQSIVIKSGSHSSTSRDDSPAGRGVLVNHPRCSSSILIQGPSPSKNNMWRNGAYADCPGSSEDKSLCSVRSTPGGMLQFAVEYLGSVPVDGSTTSLKDLQTPLNNLYMDFLSRKNVMTGQLSITSDGIKFEAPKLRLVNPFSTIAVWAAIKFVAKGEPVPTECAFMPLISDPEGQDKSRLFGPMDSDLARIYLSCSTAKTGFKNPPLFACVMREASFSLDCHAFACKCAEDAIVVAANLYQSLVDKMRSGHREGESGYGSLTRTSPSGMQSSPNNRSSSSASSSGVVTDGPRHDQRGRGIDRRTEPSSLDPEERKDRRAVLSDSESIAPIRPPRRKKKSSEISSGMKRYNSEDSILLKLPYRRRSMKNRNYQGKVKKRVQISTPEETSSADSVHESIDQVLDRIINPGGMSFNDLKPAYQELILKIALTLTQDQLYQKSKQAMKKHQLYMRNKFKPFSTSGDGSDDNSQFLNQLLKSFSKIKPGRSAASKRLSTKAGLNKFGNLPPAPRKVILKKPKEDDAFMSFCSGCVCESCSEKCYCSLPNKGNKMTNNNGCSSTGAPLSCLSSNESSVCPLGKACSENKDKPRKLCGYDSESCAESEKCYCSLQRVKSNGLKIYNINLDTETSDTDTNSYDLEPFNQHQQDSHSPASSGKTTFGKSVEILSYHPSKRLSYGISPGNTSRQTFQTTNATVHFEDSLHLPSSINTQCSNSPIKPMSPFCTAPKGEYHDMKLRDKVMLITGAQGPSARVVYKDIQAYHHSPPHDGKKSRNSSIHRNLIDIEEETSRQGERSSDEEDEDGIAPEKVLSMKKTAEIAALFSDLKLDQTTKILSEPPSGNFESMQNAEDSTASMDFEASLGYLP